MTNLPTNDDAAVLHQIRAWPPELRLSLAEAILQSLHTDSPKTDRREVPVEQVLGMAAGQGSPPDDETIRRWMAEHRAEKYG